jgi:ribonuclease P protein component
MINQKYRFHGYGSLRFVYRYGQTVRGPLFSLKSVANPKRQHYRVAVVVSRKVNKSAVVRNRIRRRLYEAVRLNQAKISQPYDIVLTVFSERIAEEPFEKLSGQLEKLLSEAGIAAKTTSDR